MEIAQDRKIKSFIIAPFGAENEQVRDILYRALQELGIEILDELAVAGAIVENGISAIESSDFVVVDMTGHNANVMYELGYAHARRIPTLLVMSKESYSAPAVVAGNLYIVYDPENLANLRDQIKRAASNLIAEVRGE